MTTISTSAGKTDGNSDLSDVASGFVSARSECRALEEFPGAIPDSLDTAYRIQDIAIDKWPQRVAGWKVGRIPPAVEDEFGIDRLAGPIFSNTIVAVNNGERPAMPVFPGGFAAVEAEYVAIVSEDAPAGKIDWSTAEAAAMIGDLRIGLEIASSPLATINDLGPPVVVSDFGNNAGLIVGPSIEDWQTRDLASMACTAYVDSEEVGSGGAFNLTGGFVRSVQFLLGLTASRGRPLRRGDVIATGQTTGIHDVAPGQVSELNFGRDGTLACKLVPAEPR